MASALSRSGLLQKLNQKDWVRSLNISLTLPTAAFQLNNGISKAGPSGPFPQGQWALSAAQTGHLCPQSIQLFFFHPCLTNLSCFKGSVVGSWFFLTQPSSLCGCCTATRRGWGLGWLVCFFGFFCLFLWGFVWLFVCFGGLCVCARSLSSLGTWVEK